MRKRLLAVVAGAGLMAVGATAGPGAAANEAGAAATCSPTTNVEFINDDSGSMNSTDLTRNRVEAIKLLLGKAANRGGRTYGAVEFGTKVARLFAPTPVTAANLSVLSGVLDQRTLGDDGGTNYNAAFAGARGNNPGAKARVFLTDGGHNEGEYAELHRGGPPTYVIGFGTSTTGESGALLARIAAETKGQYFPQTDSGSLTSVVNTIDATLNCVKTKTFTDTFTKVGQSKRHSVGLGRKTNVAEFTVLWDSNVDSFTIAGIRVVRKGKTVAVGSRRKPSKLKVKRVRGKTFVTVRVRGKALRRGKRKGKRLRFRVKAKKVSAPTKVLTSVSVANK